MKLTANEFIKKYGLENAKLYSKRRRFRSMSDCPWEYDNIDPFELWGLERVIESHELVEMFGGLDVIKSMLRGDKFSEIMYDANMVFQDWNSSKVCYFFRTRLIEAIADIGD